MNGVRAAPVIGSMSIKMGRWLSRLMTIGAVGNGLRSLTLRMRRIRRSSSLAAILS